MGGAFDGGSITIGIKHHINKHSPTRTSTVLMSPGIVSHSHSASARIRYDAANVAGGSATVAIHDRANVRRGVREGTRPFSGLPEIVAVVHPRQAEVCGLCRAADATVDTVAGARVGVRVVMVASESRGRRKHQRGDAGGEGELGDRHWVGSVVVDVRAGNPAPLRGEVPRRRVLILVRIEDQEE